ncbi:F-box/LRR-repeat protein 16 [Amphibalanus amphitrite]|uniref:F-box/LRR-repeat protein 16 n=1 Tax=Amphibalanus amphitrite TaxID=1232801 RepID=A0A6A4X5K6_AMPAM|nr:F-box/LRR-repeat protein 16 [Amphibalanus amphitrite]
MLAYSTRVACVLLHTPYGLRSLDLSWCTRVTDAALEYIACDLAHLEELVLDSDVLALPAGCTQLSPSGLSSLVQLRQLVELELTNCPGSSHELNDYLRENLPHCWVYD